MPERDWGGRGRDLQAPRNCSPSPTTPPGSEDWGETPSCPSGLGERHYSRNSGTLEWVPCRTGGK